MSQETPVISVQNVVKEFTIGGGFSSVDKFRALDDVSFDLYAGRTLALVGESGCGKSTIARVITKVHPATTGQVLFHGKNIDEIERAKDVREYRGQVQMVFQDPFGSLNPTHTIRHHLTRPLRIHNQIGNNKAEIEEKLVELLAKVELPASDLNKYPHQLSGGQRQRVNLARALGVGAKIILADEPTSMLDVSIRLGVLNLMQRMKSEMGIGFLYITHDLATAHYIAEETAVMYRGQIVEWGDTSEILTNPQHPYTKLLISAVPDPDLPFSKLMDAEPLYSEKADKIRALSAIKQQIYTQVGEANHFVRHWDGEAVELEMEVA
ncbi:Vitamin B12 import ATP-binding protein BtuD [Vibrio stylophorae]|uniref:Vitamin B12 import ATP-binding protein BtuD n=1 Tax=Vibrio stylophorae TaxID=659351 RepID=A0ABN8DZ55_9VIBR|nr:ATP-binding cassette domain-containing protein [Vibrio stylophorae]CAH0535735.1 Vitamin B12 import ATP-binding protein BtuD [Vibrio stylophorae]